MSIFLLLAGIVIAATVFASFLWCVYRAVLDQKAGRWSHIGMGLIIVIAFTPFVHESAIGARIIGTALIALGPVLILMNKWPNWLFALPPMILGAALLVWPEYFRGAI